MKKAIGYIRARKYKNRWAKDDKLQYRQIKTHAEAYGYHLLSVVREDQRFGFGRKNRIESNGKILLDTLKRCRRENAILIYVDIGRYRRNTVFQSVMREFKDSLKLKDGKTKILTSIPAAKETIEAIERHSRFEKYNERIKQLKSRRKPLKEKDDPISLWQAANKVGTKRLKNFKHLYEGALPIYKIVGEHLDLKPRDIADYLNREFFLTVNGKRWDRDNTRKTMDLIATDLFQEYVNLREELGPEAIELDF